MSAASPEDFDFEQLIFRAQHARTNQALEDAENLLRELGRRISLETQALAEHPTLTDKQLVDALKLRIARGPDCPAGRSAQGAALEALRKALHFMQVAKQPPSPLGERARISDLQPGATVPVANPIPAAIDFLGEDL